MVGKSDETAVTGCFAFKIPYRMASKTTKFLTQSITGVILLGVVSTFVADWLKSVSFLTTLKGVLLWGYNAIIWLLNFEIKVWWLLAGIAVLIGIIMLIASKTENVQPTYFNYTKDIFDEWVWKWGYRFNGKNYIVDNLKPCCPKCETPLIREQSAFHAIYVMNCPRGHELHKIGYAAHTEDIDKIEVLILDNIDKGNYEGANK